MQKPEPRAGEELERQLARYARVRLDPSPAQSRRARAVVMEAAWQRRFAVRAAEAEAASRAVRAPRRGLFSGWGARRIGVSMAAAVLAGLLVGSTTFAASRAGGPLYEARLTLEALTLPSDPTARLEAELAQSQGRVAEIAEAAARGDDAALQAAVSAYLRSLDHLDASSGAPAARALAAVQFHRTILLQLLGTAPPPALQGIERALDRSGTVIDRLASENQNPPGLNGTDGQGAGSGGNSGGQGSGGNSGGQGSGGNGQGAGTGGQGGGSGSGGSGQGGGGGKPDKSADPDQPAATAAPASAQPGGGQGGQSQHR